MGGLGLGADKGHPASAVRCPGATTATRMSRIGSPGCSPTTPDNCSPVRTARRTPGLLRCPETAHTSDPEAAPFPNQRGALSAVTHHVYVLECADGTYYTGYTTDLDRRIAEHNAGKGAKYTRGRTPVQLIHTESFGSRSAAMAREYEIKQLSRAEKERLVTGDGK